METPDTRSAETRLGAVRDVEPPAATQAVARLGLSMDHIRLSVPSGPAFHGTLRLVVGGIGARSQLSYEQVSELQLAVETLVAHRRVQGERFLVEADVDDEGISLLLGPFEAAADPARFRVLEQLVDRAAVVDRDGGQWLELTSTSRPR